MTQSFTLIAGPRQDRKAAFAHDVRAGLAATPKYLSCCYFYDRDGSLLFEEICALPEYYLTRAEREILETHAEELVARLPPRVRVVELGSGSSSKTRHLLEALLRRQKKLHYVPIDICSIILQETSLGLLRDFPDLEITAVAMEYHDGLRHLKSMEKQPQFVLWLGSNVGNFHRPDAAAFLREVCSLMTAEDRLLIGVDLRKERAILEPAYDDAHGVTGEFNLNLLARINRELGGDFDLDAFRHRAIYNQEVGRIEMYLVSTRNQVVTIRALGLRIEFAKEEVVHTENSYKYSLAEIEALGAAAGFQIAARWFDAERRFSVNLLAPRELV
jgi:dimethylhistidine N-methyltransferase